MGFTTWQEEYAASGTTEVLDEVTNQKYLTWGELKAFAKEVPDNAVLCVAFDDGACKSVAIQIRHEVRTGRHCIDRRHSAPEGSFLIIDESPSWIEWED